MKTIEQAMEGFVAHCRYEKNLSTKTIEAYGIDLHQFHQFLLQQQHSLTLVEIDKHILRSYLKELSRYKAKTIKRKVATLKALFNFLEFEDEIAVNPFRKMRIRIKAPKRLPVCLTNNEVKHIFKAAYELRHELAQAGGYAYREAVRDVAVLELLFATGMRVSELCQLTPTCIDLTAGVVRIIGKGNKERSIQLCNRETLAALKHYQRLFNTSIARCGYFFTNRLGAPLSDQSVRFMVGKYTRLARIKKHVTPHTFRHTFATLLLEENVDIKYIQSFLGHSSIVTTQIYTRVNKTRQRQILSAKHPRKKFEVSALL